MKSVDRRTSREDARAEERETGYRRDRRPGDTRRDKRLRERQAEQRETK